MKINIRIYHILHGRFDLKVLCGYVCVGSNANSTKSFLFSWYSYKSIRGIKILTKNCFLWAVA